MATAALVVLAVLFLPTLASYTQVWSVQPYTHGYLILVACAWLSWRQRDAFRGQQVALPYLLLPSVGVSLLWLAAAATDTQLVLLGTVPILLLLWTGAAIGRRAAIQLTPIVIVFLLAVPVWDALTRPLQLATVSVSGAALALLRIPADIDGDMIHIASGSFSIEGGCSGLNYLMSGLTVGALYGQMLVKGWRTQLSVFGLAALIPIVGNWFRVTTLIVMGHATDMQSMFVARSGPHVLYGWGVFLAGLGLFFPLAALLSRQSGGQPRTWLANATSATEPGADAQALRGRVILASATAGLGPLLFYVVGALPTRPVPGPTIGSTSPAWQAEADSIVRPFQWRPAFQGADESHTVVWTNGPNVVAVDRLVYHDQSQGAELVGYWNRIAPDESVRARRLLATVGPERRIVNEVVVMDEGSGALILVWYWYRVGGIETPSTTRARLLEAWAFLRRSTVSELVAVSTICAAEGCANASGTLSSFVGDT